MNAHYDDPAFSYEAYWHNRTYENTSETSAIYHLLKNRSFNSGIDIGGGYGRLTKLLKHFCRHVTLIEPSAKQRLLAKKYLASVPDSSIATGTADKLTFPDASQDLALMVRVMHHLPDPEQALKEIHRILKPDGFLVLEFANSLHFKARLLSNFNGLPILLTPVEKRSSANIRKHTIPFVNHHPITIYKMLANSGFTILDTLSVSNFRSPFLKKVIPIKVLNSIEKLTQKPMSYFYFGPSIFVLAKKN